MKEFYKDLPRGSLFVFIFVFIVLFYFNYKSDNKIDGEIFSNNLEKENIPAKKFIRNNKYIEEYEYVELIRESNATNSPTIYHNKKFGFSMLLPCYEYCISNSMFPTDSYYKNSLDLTGIYDLYLSRINIRVNDVTEDTVFYNGLYNNPDAKKIKLDGKEFYYFENTNGLPNFMNTYRGFLKDIYITSLNNNKFLTISRVISRDGDKSLEELDKDELRKAEDFKIISSIRFDK